MLSNLHPTKVGPFTMYIAKHGMYVVHSRHDSIRTISMDRAERLCIRYMNARRQNTLLYALKRVVMLLLAI